MTSYPLGKLKRTGSDNHSRCSRLASSFWQLACCLVVILSGCDDPRPQTFPVSGKVAFADGKPVRFGMIQFIPQEKGPSARAKLDMNGNFVLGTYSESDGAIAGRHDVIIVQHLSSLSGQAVRHSSDHEEGDENSMVDVRYSQLGLSPLTATVEPQANQIRLRVERPSGKLTTGRRPQ